MNSNIKFVVFDFDGVFSDGKFYFNNQDIISQSYNAKDSYGLTLLKNNNIKCGMITNDKIISIQHTPHIYNGLDKVSIGEDRPKLEILNDWLREYNFSLNEVAYIGDDLPDLEILKSVGFSACSNDAAEEVKKVVNFISTKNGGGGAVREFVDLIIKNKTFAIFIPTCIKNNKLLLEMLVKNIQLLNKNMISYKGRVDIFIINNYVNDHDLLVNELRKNNLLENIQILNDNVNNAELGIFKYFKNVKYSYKYYINIHDSCHIENIFPTLENNLYYLWKTQFFINSPSAGGTHHFNEIKAFMNKYNLTQYNLYEKLNTLNDNEILNVSDYFCFGCMFITNHEILENVYNKIKHILEYDINRSERMCLETIIGFFLYEANKKQNICAIEKKFWGSVSITNGSITNGNEFKYDYFTKICLGR